MPVTVATQVAVCSVPIAEGVATTATAVTVGCTITMDGEEVRRSYSICSGPDDGELRIAVKKVYGGAFSSWATDELKAGFVLTCQAKPSSERVVVDYDHV